MILIHFVLVVTALASVAANPFETSSRMRHHRHLRVSPRFGREELQDPNDPKYMKLAEESYENYAQTHLDSTIWYSITLKRVTRQVVEGYLYRLKFNVFRIHLGNYSDEVVCKSKVWDKGDNQKEITINCNPLRHKKGRRQGVGVEELQNPDDPKYKELAKSAYDMYHAMYMDDTIVENVIVTKVTRQVVQGFLYHLTFKVLRTSLTNLNDEIVCNAKVWDKVDSQKDFTVNCDKNKAISRSQNMITGGKISQDPNNPKYKKLAHESLEKYREAHHGIPNDVKDIIVSKVTTQLVSGVITRIYFDVLSADAGDLRCHSAVYEQPWENMKDFTVDCDKNKAISRSQNMITGGEMSQDPNDPEYKKLAHESLEKYREAHGIPNDVKDITVSKVTTQVVAGVITRIDFDVLSADAGFMRCHSAVWEQPWKSMKDFTVDCEIALQREGLGAEVEKDPNDPEYQALAQESYDKYLDKHPAMIPKAITVTRATYQVVAGTIKRIDFVVVTYYNVKLTCHSSVFEQPWLNKKDITVNCDSHGRSLK